MIEQGGAARHPDSGAHLDMKGLPKLAELPSSPHIERAKEEARSTWIAWMEAEMVRVMVAGELNLDAARYRKVAEASAAWERAARAAMDRLRVTVKSSRIAEGGTR